MRSPLNGEKSRTKLYQARHRGGYISHRQKGGWWAATGEVVGTGPVIRKPLARRRSPRAQSGFSLPPSAASPFPTLRPGMEGKVGNAAVVSPPTERASSSDGSGQASGQVSGQASGQASDGGGDGGGAVDSAALPEREDLPDLVGYRSANLTLTLTRPELAARWRARLLGLRSRNVGSHTDTLGGAGPAREGLKEVSLSFSILSLSLLFFSIFLIFFLYLPNLSLSLQFSPFFDGKSMTLIGGSATRFGHSLPWVVTTMWRCGVCETEHPDAAGAGDRAVTML